MKIWILILSLLLLSANTALGDWYVDVEPDGTIYNVGEDSNMNPSATSTRYVETTIPAEPIHYYTYTPGTGFVRKQQTDIDDIISDEEAEMEAQRLIYEYTQSLAAKEAKNKETGLDQKVIDKLTAKEK